jgi:hypothetical protein
MRSLLLVESFDLRLSNQYILIIGLCILLRVYQLILKKPPYATNVGARFIVQVTDFEFFVLQTTRRWPPIGAETCSVKSAQLNEHRHLLRTEVSTILVNQYILLRLIPSCFRFAKMCLSQVSLLSGCSPRYLTSSSQLCTVYMDRGACFPSCSECYVDRLGSVSIQSPFF